MTSNPELPKKILQALSQRSQPIPLGTLAMRVSASELDVAEVVSLLVVEGKVRIARPPEVEQGVVAYTTVDPKPWMAYEAVPAAPPSRKTASWAKVIAFDYDGVLGDFITPCCQVMSQVTGRPYHPSEQKVWDLFGLLSDEERKEVFRVIESPGWCETIQPYPGAVEAVQMFREAGHTLLCVTAPWTSPTWEYERKRALQHQFGKDIVMISTHSKEFVGCDVLVEDKVSNLEKWVDRQRGKGFLIAHPYNEQYPSQKMVRVASLQEVFELC